ncbi:fasciclin-like arabinogalactan protein 8 [Striga asiatica]|uniref:Fasciclin-like arabinogalactan protein 8 n=1 Tax=Striga asiatica TaxID=4170 RepID=A0A5A7QG75_STRAF|nr:fasciclin-like arabinogalactan protein 8 [Striga asiatica]
MASENRPQLGLNITQELIDGNKFNVEVLMLTASGFGLDMASDGISSPLPTRLLRICLFQQVPVANHRSEGRRAQIPCPPAMLRRREFITTNRDFKGFYLVALIVSRDFCGHTTTNQTLPMLSISIHPSFDCNPNLAFIYIKISDSSRSSFLLSLSQTKLGSYPTSKPLYLYFL